MTPAITASRRPAVRAPFRILAALLCLTFIGVAVGLAYMTWKGGAQALRVQDVLMLPGGLWLGRLMLMAALGSMGPPKDSVSRHDYWPFATARVAGCYWLIVLGVSVATP